MRFGWFKSKQLSEDEARLLMEQLVAISNTTLPLASGLRCAAAGVAAGRLRTTMEQLADRFELGEGMESVLRDQLQYCPADLRGVIAAALNSGQVAEVLGQYVKQQQTRRDLTSAIRGILAYPTLLLALCLGLVMLYSIFVLRDLGPNILGGFWFDVPPRVQILNWWSETGVWYLVHLIWVAAIALIATRFLVGAARWRRIKNRIPLLGPIYHWIGVLEWSGTMSLLLNHRVPLAQAIRWASQGSSDPAIRQSGTEMAADAEQGMSLSRLLESAHSLPGTLALHVRWGEQANQLPAALATAAEYFEDRARLRLTLLRVAAPPLVFAIVVLIIVLLFGTVITALLSVFAQFTF